MAKRAASNQLNHDNWNQDEDPEEAGTYSTASASEMERRIVKKAKRRLSPEKSEGKSLFSGFSGFNSTSNNNSSSPQLFSFLSNTNASANKISSPEKSNIKFSSQIQSSQSLGTSVSGLKNGFNNIGSSESASMPGVENVSSKSPLGLNTVMQQKQEQLKEKKNTDFLHHLKNLNQCVTNWIKEHVDKNPFCILTPIFKDYERYIEELQNGKSLKTTPTTSNFPSTSPATNLSKIKSEDSTKTVPVIINPLLSSNSQINSNSQTQPSSFSFAVSKPVAASNSIKAEEDEEYKPPINEVQEVKEDSAFYSKRCKLFYKKDGSFKEKGVGTLHLKPHDGKTQLLIRAETNLGNILLNILLTPYIPTQRVKNNINLICIPNPKIDDSDVPVPLLIRVKTEKDAEELLSKLNEAKL